MPNPAVLILSGLLVFSGAIVSAMAGFGFGIATIPFFLLLYPPKTTLALTLLVTTYGVAVQWLRVRKHADYRLVLGLSAGAAVGLPLGGLLLSVISEPVLKALIGAAVLVAATRMLLRPPEADLPSRRPHLATNLATGFGAGLLSTSVGQPGLPIAFLMAWTRVHKETVRATIVSFFVLLDLGSVATYLVQGIITTRTALIGVAMAPFYFTGLFMGDHFFRRTGHTAYRRVMLAVLSVAAFMGVLNGLIALLG